MKATSSAQFNPIYWASLIPAIAALARWQGQVRLNAAMNLATKGYIIDANIQGRNWDPYTAMAYRQDDGYTWVPNALGQPIESPPGVVEPGIPPYNPLAPPAGSIKVSLEIGDLGVTSWGDYPPYIPPVPPPVPPVVASLVGDDTGAMSSWGEVYIALGAPGPDGTPYLDPLGRGTFVIHLINTPFGYNKFFTPQQQVS